MSNGILNNLLGSSFEKDNVEQIGDNVFIFNLTLDNGKSKVKLKFSAIEELNIVDDLRYFYVYGAFTINYNQDVLEAFESIGSGMGMNSDSSEAYQFRGDGRDILEIDIMPQIEEQRCLEVYASESDREKYNIKHKCSIYKYEDLTSGQGKKSRKFYFWDLDYQYLNEIYLNYSSADNFTNEKKAFTYNTGESVEIAKSNTDVEEYTGIIIDNLLTESLVEIAGVPFRKGYWEEGETKFNYSSPGQYSSMNDIEYVLAKHTSTGSNNYMPALLKKQRYTDKYELKPLNLYYKQEGFFGGILGGVLGGFFGGGGSDSSEMENFYLGKIDPVAGAGLSQMAEANINLSDYNLIDDYTFTRVDAKDLQAAMRDHVVYTQDPRGYFVADIKENNLKSAKDVYDASFVNGGANNLPKNKIREEHKNIQHNFVPYSMDVNQRKNVGVNQNILNLFFKNTSISFRIRGNTYRKTSNFFNVKRRDSNISNTYDNTVLGEYMITYVRHEFKAGGYTTLVHGVKPFDKQDPNLPTVT